jgi:hypothetical protein
MFLLFFDELWE